MSAFMRELELKSFASSTMHLVWEQYYRNYLKTLVIINGPDLEKARKYADDVVASVRKCYHDFSIN